MKRLPCRLKQSLVTHKKLTEFQGVPPIETPIQLNFYCVSAFFDLIELMKLSSSGARAFFTCTLPIFGRSKIAVPKWPSFTLTWTRRINVAFSGFTIKKNAITVTKLFKTSPRPNFSGVLVFKFLQWHAQRVSNGLNLGWIDPNKSRGAGTAIATARTGKFESFFVPKLWCLRLCHPCSLVKTLFH